MGSIKIIRFAKVIHIEAYHQLMKGSLLTLMSWANDPESAYY